MCRDTKFINLAYSVSFHSEHQFPIGAVITLKNRVISTGFNKIKTHPRQINPYTGRHGKSIHAELSAILSAPRDYLHGATIYVVRRLANGNYGKAKPCKSCVVILKEVGIRRVVYTNGVNDIREERI